MLSALLRYLLRGYCKNLLFGGKLFFWLVNILIGICCLGLVLEAFFGICLIGFIASMAAAAANGEDEQPDWPDMSDFLSIFTLALMLMGTVVICFFLAWCFIGFFDSTSGMRDKAISWALMGLGLFYFSISLLAVVLFNIILAMNLPTGLTSILKIYF